MLINWLKRLETVGSSSEDTKAGYKVILTNRIAIISFLLAFPYIFVFGYFKLVIATLAVFPTLLICLSILILNKNRRNRMASALTVFGITAVVLFYSLHLGFNSGAHLIFFPLVAWPFILFQNNERFLKYSGFLFLIFCVLVNHYFRIVYMASDELLLSYEVAKIIYFIATMTTVSFITATIYFFYKSERKIREKLEISNAQLHTTITQLTQETQDKEAALIREHKKAEKIKAQAKKIKTHALEIQEKQVQEKLLKQAGNYQQLLFQESIPQPHNQTISVFGSASHHITGDYRYIAQISEHISGLIVLDVTGHGAPAAMMTGILSKDVDCLFETSSPDLLTDTGATMKVLNKTFTRERRLSKLIAGVYAVADTQQNVVHVTCAGSETAMIYRDGKIISIKNSNESLRMDEDSDFTSVTLPIQSGDIIIVCSDGLMDRKLNDGSPLFLAVEAEGDYDEEAGEYPEILLDYTQFEAILSKWTQKEALAEYLGETLDQLCRPASDDMTIIAVEIA